MNKTKKNGKPKSGYGSGEGAGYNLKKQTMLALIVDKPLRARLEKKRGQQTMKAYVTSLLVKATKGVRA